MIILEVFFALWWLWLPLLIVWYFVHNKKADSSNHSKPSSQDLVWHNYILSFKDVVKTRAEKNLINAILERKTADQLYQKAPGSETQPLAAAAAQEVSPVLSQEPQPAAKPIDNTLLLLYFGAFLLIAAAGLFVAIGNMNGTLRSFILAITAGLLYTGGIWLYKTKPKLTQAGISFIGVGMMIAPLVGVAWYNLVADQTNGALIWMVTSLFCLGLYAHAYATVKNSFIAYLLIGSFVSSVESAVLAVALPSYVYAWAAIALSLVLQVGIILRTKQTQQFIDASDTSAQLLVPLSFFSSLVLTPHYGNMQLAVTLLLAGGYYALIAWQRPNQITEYATASQLAFIGAICNIVYLLDRSFDDVALVLGVITGLYALVIALTKTSFVNKFNLVIIASLTSAGSIVLSVENGWPLVLYSTLALLLASVVWLKLFSNTALTIAGILALIIPYEIGQDAITPHISAISQLGLFAVSTLAIFGVVAYSAYGQRFRDYYETASMLFIIGSVIMIITAWISGYPALLASSLGLALLFSILQKISKESGWWLFSGVYVLIPILYSFTGYGISDRLFSISVAIGLGANIIISLVSREKAIRAIVVLCVLLAPLAVGGGGLGFQWEEAGYSAGYLLAMAGCIIARAIARGKLFVSSKVALSSYEREASQVFVAGYTISAMLAVLISLFDENSRLVTTLVLGVICAALVYLCYMIESNNKALVLLPILLQGMLFSGLRPDIDKVNEVALAALASSLLAVLVYILLYYSGKMRDDIQKQLMLMAVITSYFGPGLVLFGVEVSAMMPVALLIAGGLTVFHNRSAAQTVKELSILVVVASIHWYLFLMGVENIHIHTHLLAAVLGCFAYWRYTLNDRVNSNNYVIALFVVATVPLIIQALSGQSGGNYGVLLICQQVLFMLIGVILNQRFLLKAGLWIALGSILYQLRGLGWAFLGIVAVVLIAIAIYRLQKHEDSGLKN